MNGDGPAASDVATARPASNADDLAATPRKITERHLSFAALGLPIIVTLIAIVGWASTAGYISIGNLRAILISASITGIAAVALTPTTMSGNLISVATSQSAMLAAVLFAVAMKHGWNIGLAVLIVLLVLAGTGVAQGVVMAAGLNPIITTMAAGAIILGSVSAATNNQLIAFNVQRLGWLARDLPLGLPLAAYFFIGVTAVVTFLVHRTTIGRHIVLTGANRYTAQLSGVPVRLVSVICLVILALGAALDGILAAAPLGTVDSSFLSSLTIDAFVAIMVGGTSVHGGHGSPFRSAIGALVVAMLDSLMLLNNMSYGERLSIKGLIVVAVVVALTVSQNKETR